METCSVVDIFCGVGGLTHGFVKEGFNVVAGLDCDPSCRYAFEHNNQAAFIHAKIEDVRAKDIIALYPERHIKVLVGCAPCQDYSKYTQKNRINDQELERNEPIQRSEKWKLLEKFADIIEGVNPEVVSMENVPELVTFKDGAVFRAFVERLESSGYTVTYDPVYCPDYGIPQERMRLVLFASKFGGIPLIPKTHKRGGYTTVKATISALPPIEAGETCSGDRLHQASRLSDTNLKRIRASTPGGSWRDWPEDLIADCHKKESGKTYVSVYGRMKWTEPAPTITTQFYGFGNGRFGHPEQNRAISLREGALLQTFPATYEFVDPNEELHIKVVGRHIGNAVPVDLGRVIARSIKRHLETQNGE